MLSLWCIFVEHASPESYASLEEAHGEAHLMVSSLKLAETGQPKDVLELCWKPMDVSGPTTSFMETL